MKQFISQVSVFIAGSITAFLFSANLVLPMSVSAQSDVACRAGDPGCTYIPLTTIPGVSLGCNPGLVNGKISTEGCTPVNPVNVIKNFYGIAIGIAAVLAVIMIIFAGLKYITVESITGHSDAKDTWTGAIYGLLLLLGSYVILRTINLDLVNVNFDLGTPKAGVKTSNNALESFVTAANEAATNFQREERQLADNRVYLDGLKRRKTELEAEIAKASDATVISNLRQEITSVSSKITDTEKIIDTQTATKSVAGAEAAIKQFTLLAESYSQQATKNPTLAIKLIEELETKKRTAFSVTDRHLNDYQKTALVDQKTVDTINAQKLASLNTADQSIALIRASNSLDTNNNNVSVMTSLNQSLTTLMNSRTMIESITRLDPAAGAQVSANLTKNITALRTIASEKLGCPTEKIIISPTVVRCDR